MATLVLFSLISLLWAGTGLAMVVAPSSWNGWVRDAFLDPLKRFLVTQGALLAGLVLILGAAGRRGQWLWMTIGLLGVGKALFLLGLTEPRRERVLSAWQRLPPWAHRVAGVLTVSLATLLAIDTVRGPQ